MDKHTFAETCVRRQGEAHEISAGSLHCVTTQTRKFVSVLRTDDVDRNDFDLLEAEWQWSEHALVLVRVELVAEENEIVNGAADEMCACSVHGGDHVRAIPLVRCVPGQIAMGVPVSVPTYSLKCDALSAPFS